MKQSTNKGEMGYTSSVSGETPSTASTTARNTSSCALDWLSPLQSMATPTPRSGSSPSATVTPGTSPVWCTTCTNTVSTLSRTTNSDYTYTLSVIRVLKPPQPIRECAAEG
jgi:hypothetical protein